MAKDKKFRTFDSMMKQLNGVSFKEFSELYPELKNHVEDHGEFASIFACHDNNKLVTDIAQEQNWQIITYSIEDGDDSCFAIYSTGMGFVNREKYLFCKSNKSGFCEEEF
jgi:hypothetical protein